jgi:hypothetical protein
MENKGISGMESVKELQEKLVQIEGRYEPLRKSGVREGQEWDQIGKEAAAVRRTLYELTGDAYGRPKVKRVKPDDSLLEATYETPEDVPPEVLAWVRSQSLLHSDATDAVRWARIIDTQSDARYPQDEVLTLYRAVERNVAVDEIRPGDWVTTERGYAEEHLRRWFGGKGTILEMEAVGRDVLVSPTGNDEEAIYAPYALSGPVNRKSAAAPVEQNASQSNVEKMMDVNAQKEDGGLSNYVASRGEVKPVPVLLVLREDGKFVQYAAHLDLRTGELSDAKMDDGKVVFDLESSDDASAISFYHSTDYGYITTEDEKVFAQVISLGGEPVLYKLPYAWDLSEFKEYFSESRPNSVQVMENIKTMLEEASSAWSALPEFERRHLERMQGSDSQTLGQAIFAGLNATKRLIPMLEQEQQKANDKAAPGCEL